MDKNENSTQTGRIWILVSATYYLWDTGQINFSVSQIPNFTMCIILVVLACLGGEGI